MQVKRLMCVCRSLNEPILAIFSRDLPENLGRISLFSQFLSCIKRSGGGVLSIFISWLMRARVMLNLLAADLYVWAGSEVKNSFISMANLTIFLGAGLKGAGVGGKGSPKTIFMPFPRYLCMSTSRWMTSDLKFVYRQVWGANF